MLVNRSLSDCLRVAAAPLRAFDRLRALRHSGRRPGRKNRRSRPNKKTNLQVKKNVRTTKAITDEN